MKVKDLFEKVTDSWTPQDKNAHEFNYYVGLENIESNTGSVTLSAKENSFAAAPSSNKIRIKNDDILYGKLRPNLNKVAFVSLGDSICSTDFLVLRPKDSEMTSAKLWANLFLGKWFNDKVLRGVSGASLPRVKPEFFFDLEIPQIPQDVQAEMLEQFQTEQKIATANKTLIEIYQQKIKSKLAEVWGE